MTDMTTHPIVTLMRDLDRAMSERERLAEQVREQDRKATEHSKALDEALKNCGPVMADLIREQRIELSDHDVLIDANLAFMIQRREKTIPLYSLQFKLEEAQSESEGQNEVPS